MVLEKDAYAQQSIFVSAWNFRVGREMCADVQAGLNREWLVTNGLGGYASGSLLGATTRSYHGLLVAALRPPVARTVLVAKIDEEVTLPGDQEVLKLGVNEYQDGTIEPQGFMYLESVTLDGDVPSFIYRLNETLRLEKRVWMEYGQNTTYVQYILHGILDDDAYTSDAVIDPASTVTLTLSPFCLARDYHAGTQGADDWRFLLDCQENRCCVRAHENAPACYLIADPAATFYPAGSWHWSIHHRRDCERGMLDHEDLYQPGVFRMQIVPGMRRTLVLSSEDPLPPEWGSAQHDEAVAHALLHHQRRIRQLLSVADPYQENLQEHDPVLARLIVAADQFIVARPDYSENASKTQELRLSPDRKTLIAGYPWFTDWGRDSMISLPGLFLHTGRYSEARGLFKAFASFMSNGLIPNRFPDSGEPDYNTADATLWMFTALDQYVTITRDWSLLKELFPLLSESIEWHLHGTDYGIHVDPADGLLCAGVPGGSEVALTWMDARVDDWVVTPRCGKPVEVNALWYTALTAMEAWAVRLAIDATQYSQLRSRVRQHFAARFWHEAGGYLYDVVDVDGIAGQNDAALRPNQLFAASLTHDLLSDEQVSRILQNVTTHLLTPCGLRSLAPTDPQYHKLFKGDRWQRDSAYHQGTVWQWLIGPYIDVHLRVYNDRAALRPLLRSMIEQLWRSCLGTVSEVAEPEPPFSSAGCFAQAWSVAELLRCWLIVAH
jgi:predicted glycogen debranching enzyme